MSGIGYDGKNIWVTEYDNKQLHRLNPILLAAWSQGDFRTSQYSAFQGSESPIPAAVASATADPETATQLLRKLREDPFGTRAAAEELIKLGAKEQVVQVLREMIKDPDQSVRVRARSTMRDGAPINYDRYSRSSTTSGDDANGTNKILNSSMPSLEVEK